MRTIFTLYTFWIFTLENVSCILFPKSHWLIKNIRKYSSTFYVGMGQLQNGCLHFKNEFSNLQFVHKQVQVYHEKYHQWVNTDKVVWKSAPHVFTFTWLLFDFYNVSFSIYLFQSVLIQYFLILNKCLICLPPLLLRSQTPHWLATKVGLEQNPVDNLEGTRSGYDVSKISV